MPDALAKLRDAGFLLIVTTNQPDVARGNQTRATVEAINQYLAERLPLDDIEACYHDDADLCACRKPKPGMIRSAAERHGIDIAASYMIGDRWRDVDAGLAAGCTTILIDRGIGKRFAERRRSWCPRWRKPLHGSSSGKRRNRQRRRDPSPDTVVSSLPAKRAVATGSLPAVGMRPFLAPLGGYESLQHRIDPAADKGAT